MDESRVIKIVIDEEVRQAYLKYYFDKYERRRVEPVKLFPPSLNKFMTLQRMTANAMKQKYKEYSVFLASYFGIANIKLENAEMKYTFYYGDRRRRDVDNLLICPKMLNDGMVDAGVLVDDDSRHLGLLIERTKYDKEHPRIEIEITEVLSDEEV